MNHGPGHATPAAASSQPHHLVLLRADRLRLLLPQSDVVSADHLHASNAPTVLAISGRMALLDHVPADRTMVTRLRGDAAGIVWAWQDVKVLYGASLRLNDLPAVLRCAATLVDSYVEDEDGVAFVSSAQRLRALLSAAMPA